MCEFNTIKLESVSLTNIEDVTNTSYRSNNYPTVLKRIAKNYGETSYVAHATYMINGLYFIDNKRVYAYFKVIVSYETDDDPLSDYNCHILDSLISKVNHDGWLKVSIRHKLAKFYNVNYDIVR